jgi:hypothetical protein
MAEETSGPTPNGLEKAGRTILFVGGIFAAVFLFNEVTGCIPMTKRHPMILRSQDPRIFEQQQEFGLVLAAGTLGVGSLLWLGGKFIGRKQT